MLKRVFSRKFTLLCAIALNLIIIAVLITISANYFIQDKFQQVPIVSDLLWEYLPHVPIFWLSEILIIVGLAYMAIWGYKTNKYLLPYAAALIAIFHIIRAGVIILTPLGFPYTYEGLIQVGKTTSVLFGGAFPSGHLAFPYLIFMITKSYIVLAITILVGAILLLSRAHYSIDLVGTLLVAYLVFKFSEAYMRGYFLKWTHQDFHA